MYNYVYMSVHSACIVYTPFLQDNYTVQYYTKCNVRHRNVYYICSTVNISLDKFTPITFMRVSVYMLLHYRIILVLYTYLMGASGVPFL